MPVSKKTTQSLSRPMEQASFAHKIVGAPSLHTDENPLWKGPGGDGWNGGVTQSMISRFLSCRERFRIKYLLGLEPHPRWNHRLGYGNMWHVCEEAFAAEVKHFGEYVGTTNIEDALECYTQKEIYRYPLQAEEITKWHNVCSVQFPEYINYWSEHPDVLTRVPLMQEVSFDVPYQLPSRRIVRLRGKWDSVDLIDNGIYLQENKTKGDIDKLQIERQLKFDLQTMFYLTALEEIQQQTNAGETDNPLPDECVKYPIKGVRYNVVRRPLSGGKGNIKPHSAKITKTKITPAETNEEFYERLRRDYIAAEPDYWFFRIRSEVDTRDIVKFRGTCLDPILETMCSWYEELSKTKKVVIRPPLNYRTPFGVYSALEENGATEYDQYMDIGSEALLTRVTELFPELK